MAHTEQSDSLFIRLLGDPAWMRRPERVASPLSRKDAALLAVLAVDGPQPRERLAALLWPDVPGARASSNLRQRLFRLRQQTGHALIDSGELIRPTASVQFDVHLLGESDGADGIDLSHELLGALDFTEDGDLLEDWVRQARGRWRDRRVDLLTGLAARQEAAGELAAALGTVQHLLVLNPLLEHAWRRQMRLHHLRGDRAAAVTSFERCESVLKDELGLKPSTETQDLLREIEHGLRQDVRTGASRRRPLPPALIRPPECVGRGHQVEQMQAAWQAGRPFLLIGDAGLGKSRLLADLGRQEPDCLLTQALPGDELVPYAALARLLRQAFSRDGLKLAAALRAELCRLLPELGSPPPGPADDALLQRVLDQTLMAVREAGWRAALMDDLHHADSATWATLHRHAGADDGLRLGFSCRPDSAGGASAPLLSDSVRAVPVPLPPLGEADTCRFVQSLLVAMPLPGEGAGPPDSARCQDLARHAGGNPFFVLETLKAWWLAGDAQSGVWPLAPSVGALIEQRLRPLSGDSLALARVAALAGADFSPELAAQVMDRPMLALADAWAELEALQLLHPDGFANEMVRQTVHDGMPRALRTSLHRRVATALADQHAPAERVALHHAQAGDWAEAGRATRSAAEAVRRLGQRAEELAQWRQAAQWLDQAGLETEAFDARLASVNACAVVEGLPAGKTLLERLLSDPLLADPVLPAIRRRLAATHIEACLLRSDLDEFEAAVDHGRAAIAITEPEEPLGWRARAAQAMNFALHGRAGEGIDLLEQVLTYARPVASSAQLAELLNEYAYVLSYACRRRQAVRVLEEVLERSTLASGPSHMEVVALGNLAVQYTVLGRQDDAIAAGLRASRLAKQLGPTLETRNSEVNLAMYLFGAGRFRESLALLQEVLDDAKVRAPGTALQHCAEEFFAEAWLGLGLPDRARSALAETPLAQVSGVRRAFRLDLLARLTSPAQAVEAWREALKAAEVATPMPTRVRVRLNASQILPIEEALALCAAAREESRSGEYPPGELLADVREADVHWRRGDVASGWRCAVSALQRHDGGVRHVFLRLPELLGQVWRFGHRLGLAGDQDAAARSTAAHQRVLQWWAQLQANGELSAQGQLDFLRGRPWLLAAVEGRIDHPHLSHWPD